MDRTSAGCIPPAFPSSPFLSFLPLSPTPKSSSWCRNCVFPQRVSVLLGMLVGVAFGGWSEMDRSNFRGKVSVLSICGIYSFVPVLIFFLKQSRPRGLSWTDADSLGLFAILVFMK